MSTQTDPARVEFALRLLRAMERGVHICYGLGTGEWLVQTRNALGFFNYDDRKWFATREAAIEAAEKALGINEGESK